MIYLIVPPIIIIIAIAVLIVFLTRVLSQTNEQKVSIDRNDKKVLKDTDKNVTKDTQDGEDNEKNKHFTKGKKLLQDTGNTATKHIRKTLKKTGSICRIKSDNVNDSIITQGILTGKKVENVVSLRKKSMVSDKIENKDVADSKEMELMKDIEKDPHNSKKYEKLADYYMEQEKFEDARECYKYVLRLDPRHKRAQIAMKNLDRVLR